MTRTERIQPNPNHYVGNHPLINSDQLDQYYPKPEDSHPVSPSPLDDASFRKGTVDWQPSHSNRKSLERAIQQISAAELPGGEHLIGYLQDQYRRNCKAATIRSAAEAIRCFWVFLKAHAIGKLEDIRRQHIGAFIEHEQDRGLKITSVRQKLQNVYAFMRYLSREERVVPELLLRKIHLKLPQRLPRAIPAEDVLKLLSVIDRVRNRAIILLLLRTGMRIGEALNLHTTDVDLNERTVKIYEGEKNATGRVVYLSEDARQAIAAWLKLRQVYKPRLFYGQGHHYLCYNSARVMFKKYLHNAGLADKGYTVHCLRHTCATELLNAGMRIECLQQLLGHSKLEVTRIYARLTDKTREQEYFKAMAIIEAGGIDGSDRCDH
jgi:site-specific recombinase XerD